MIDEGEMPFCVMMRCGESGGHLCQSYGVVGTPARCYPPLTWQTSYLLGEMWYW